MTIPKFTQITELKRQYATKSRQTGQCPSCHEGNEWKVSVLCTKTISSHSGNGILFPLTDQRRMMIVQIKVRDTESLRCHKFIELYHQILIVLINHIHLPQASETKTWIYNRKTGILWILLHHVCILLQCHLHVESFKLLQSIWFPGEKLSFVKNKTGASSPILQLWTRILVIFNWHSITCKYHCMGFMAVLCSFGDNYYI